MFVYKWFDAHRCDAQSARVDIACQIDAYGCNASPMEMEMEMELDIAKGNESLLSNSNFEIHLIRWHGMAWHG